MDPVTGLSRRSLTALAVAVALGVVASTAATVIAAHGDQACPEPTYGCATFERGEPVQLALVASSPGPGFEAPTSLRGRPVVLHEFAVGCSVEEAAAAAREIATDRPDGPPFLGAVAVTCREAGIALAQLLGDSGISLVFVGAPPDRPVPTPFALVASDASAAGAALLGAAARVAVEHDGALLVPRTPLRDGLAEGGLALLRGPA